ncbi:MAG: phosphate uptake regulator PhoU [Candidatus Geothermarchaeales archaeon]
MSNSVELRKVQITGRSTFTVSLPKDWAVGVGLRPGSQVALIPQDDMSLRIVPRGELKPEEVREASLKATAKMDPDTLIRDFIACYLIGFDTIRVGFAQQTSKHRVVLKETVRRKLMGVEVIEESANEMTAQCLLGYRDLPVDRALSRMSVLASSMHEDALTALKKLDHDLARQIVERDDEIDRFYFFIVRQLKNAVRNRGVIEEIGLKSPRHCLGYRLIVKSTERVADHVARIAKIILTMNTPPSDKLLEGIAGMNTSARKIYDDAFKALYREDVKLAHETIATTKQMIEFEEKVIEPMLNMKIPPAMVVKLRLILESIRRIAEYGSDIAEIVLNLTAEG